MRLMNFNYVFKKILMYNSQLSTSRFEPNWDNGLKRIYLLSGKKKKERELWTKKTLTWRVRLLPLTKEGGDRIAPPRASWHANNVVWKHGVFRPSRHRGPVPAHNFEFHFFLDTRHNIGNKDWDLHDIILRFLEMCFTVLPSSINRLSET